MSNVKEIAVLLTCHNRREKTMECLRSLYLAFKNEYLEFRMSIYLTDDGSTDGTALAVMEKFNEVNIIQGDGNLFWAGGMRECWRAALEEKFDGYLLINDDTVIDENLFSAINETGIYSAKKYGIEGVYIGATINKDKDNITYGGSIITDKIFQKQQKLSPENRPIECDIGNANIMYVPHKVVEKIGILYNGYIHGSADYDYTLMAKRNDIPVLQMPGVLGVCDDDHNNAYDKFASLNIRQRIKFLLSPKGLKFSDKLIYMRRNFPYRLPLVIFMGLFKVLFPKQYRSIRGL